METTNTLGLIVFVCIMIVACFFPYFYKKSVQKRYRKLQEAAIQFELFEYCGSISQHDSIFNFYLNKATKKIWYTQKKICGSRVIESYLMPCEVDLEDIYFMGINGQKKEGSE